MALKLRSKKGQVLLELVIVMAVLVLLLVALVSLVVLSLSTIQKSRLRARATDIAQEGLEDVRLERDQREDWEEFVNTVCLGEIAAGSWDQAVGDFTRDADCSVTATDSEGDPTKVTATMTVEWDFTGKHYTIALETDLATKVGGILR